MRIGCIGGGPAGLYFAILMKEADPAHEVTVWERNRADDTFGWGVVFSDATLANFAEADAACHVQIFRRFRHWDGIDIWFKGGCIRSTGHGFAGLSRRALLDILQGRARELGVKLEFGTNVLDPDSLTGYDLIVAADGIHSRTRQRYAEVFRPDIDVRKCRYIWYGTHRKLDAFTFIFEETPWGWFQAHAYRFDEDTSTFIVETREETWRAAGLDRMSTQDSIAFCEKLFAERLGGERLMVNSGHARGSAWLAFPRVLCEKWYHGRLVLIGDAAHTAHFSIGSGTKLAMEDAIALAATLREEPVIENALARYQQERSLEALKLQNAARNRMEWFENVARYVHLEPLQFAYSLLTGSQRIGHDNLRARDPAFVREVETWLSERAGAGAQPRPPMFLPFELRGMRLENRVVVSPMSMYSAEDGTPGDFHLVHYGARAQGGAGLLFTEMTDVSREARITPGCAGLYKDEHVAAWKRIVDFVHTHTRARIALQLGHAGPKGSTRLGWEGMDEPLPEGNWPLIAPSAISWSPANQVPREMDASDMARVKAQFVAATERAIECGFDLLELHCAHGYLLSAFISPLTNRRSDAYGGSLENRLRYPLEVFRAMRAAWPEQRPMSVRISATDWVPGGITAEDSVVIARAFRDAGCDLIDVSAGQTSRDARPVYGRMFQTPFSDRIRNETGIATMAVGNIYEADQVNSIVAAGRADLVALARAQLADPYFTLRAAAAQAHAGQFWPPQYLTAREQLARILARAATPPGAV
ncbi:MAG: bifunctional salicylyl-CoA 5-hydroxylase/oxidoreductase [Rhodocyclaceae bacterium]